MEVLVTRNPLVAYLITSSISFSIIQNYFFFETLIQNIIVVLFCAAIYSLGYLLAIRTKKRILWTEGLYVTFKRKFIVNKILIDDIALINHVNGFYGKHHIEIVLKSDKKMTIHLSPYSSDNDISELKIQIEKFNAFLFQTIQPSKLNKLHL